MKVFSVILAVTVLIGIAGYLVWSLIDSIRTERRRSGVRRIWRSFGLSIAFCALFLLSWIAQGVTEWSEYQAEQRTHGEESSVSGYIVTFGQSTLENWQSEFLQLFAFVVLSAVLIHRGSAESKDSTDRMEGKIDAIIERLDQLEAESI